MAENLTRFETAHELDYNQALSEIRNGRKQSHWMWYIFPQLVGLGHSATAKHYAIQDLAEAADFLGHPVLGRNIVSIARELLALPTNDATVVFGKPDNMKLRSSITLFACVPGSDPVFRQVLDKYFQGVPDNATLEGLGTDAASF